MALTPGAQHHVAGHAHGAHQAHAQAILRHEGHGDTGLADIHGILAHQLLRLVVLGRVVGNGAGGDGVQARDGLQQFTLTGAGHTGHAQYLACLDIEAHIVQTLDAQFVEHGQPLQLQAGGDVLGLGTVDVQADTAAHHHVRQGLLVGVLGQHIAYVLALAEHGHAVGHVQNLVELVGDDDEGLAIGLHVAHDGEQLVRLLRRQHGGRLIQDEDVGAAVQHLDDLDGLLLGNGHVVDLHVGVNVEAVLVADVLHLFAGVGKVQLALQAQDDVLRGREQIDQLEVLMDHADAESKRILGRCNGHGLVVDVDLPLVGEIDAGEHVHQSGLAAAVFTQQRQDLTLTQLHVDRVVGDNFSEPLGDVLHFDRAFVFQGCHPFFRRRRLQHLANAGALFHAVYFTIHVEPCKSKITKKL